jgi:hypothetical protein
MDVVPEIWVSRPPAQGNASIPARDVIMQEVTKDTEYALDEMGMFDFMTCCHGP